METRKEKIKSNVIVIIITGIFLAFTGYMGYLTGSKSGLKLQYKKECETFKITKANLTNTYDETTISKRSLQVKVKTYHYSFTINNQNYLAEKTFVLDKPDDAIEVWYNPNKPAENKIENPCKRYNSIINEKEGNYLIIQLLGILAIILLVYNVFSLIKNSIILGTNSAIKKFSKK